MHLQTIPRVAIGYNKLKDQPEVKKLFEAIKMYQQDLKRLRIDDAEVRNLES